MRLDGRTALVTGGTGGGSSHRPTTGRGGSDLILHGLEDDELCRDTVQACEKTGATVKCVFTDLAGPTDVCVASLLADIDGFEPEITLLVNNAGTYCDLPYLEMDQAAFEKTMRLNVYAGYFLTQAFAKRWIAAGIAQGTCCLRVQ